MAMHGMVDNDYTVMLLYCKCFTVIIILNPQYPANDLLCTCVFIFILFLLHMT